MSQPNTPLDRTRVLALIDSYGADIERFPAAEREAARATIAGDPMLQAKLREAAELDTLLAHAPAPAPSAALQRAVAEIPLRHPQTDPSAELGLWQVFGAGLWGRLRLAAGFALALAAGVSAGAMTQTPTTADAGDMASLGEKNEQDPTELDDEAWEDLMALAFADGLTLDELDGLDDAQEAL